MATTYKKMSKKWKRLWIEALRSKKYKQAVGGLKRGGGVGATYCCLGVLCDVFNKGLWDGEAYEYEGILSGSEVPCTLRDDVIKLDKDAEARLINMNDMKGKGFVAISNWIEKTL